MGCQLMIGNQMTNKIQEINFEEALRQLEEIVTRLESGDLTLEEAMSLFEEGQRNLNKKSEEEKPAEDDATIPVELSARHVHLTQEHIDELFGGSLKYKKELSQWNYINIL